MNHPFNIKFIIFNEDNKTTKFQKKIKEKIIYEDMRHIIKKIFENDVNYKFLDRVEASVTSLDETKQLRLYFDNIHIESIKYQHSLHFHQLHSCCKEYFTLSELKYISNKIKIGLENFLHYEIDEPIIYIEIDQL